jgi:hypothetical protein
MLDWLISGMTRRSVPVARNETLSSRNSVGFHGTQGTRLCGQTRRGKSNGEKHNDGNAFHVPSNGEVEGPRRSAQSEPRVHTVFPHPRRHYRLSRTPPTIVRSHLPSSAPHFEQNFAGRNVAPREVAPQREQNLTLR